MLAVELVDPPRLPDWAGGFGGEVIHSGASRNAAPYVGRRVLVAGFGNSGGDIALDLAEAGVEVAISVCGPVNIPPKNLLGMRITWFGPFSRLLGPRWQTG